MLRQLLKEVGMCVAVQCQSHRTPVGLTLVGIEESSGPGRSETALAVSVDYWKETHRKPLAEYKASARPMKCADPDLPTPRVIMAGTGKMTELSAFPV